MLFLCGSHCGKQIFQCKSRFALPDGAYCRIIRLFYLMDQSVNTDISASFLFCDLLLLFHLIKEFAVGFHFLSGGFLILLLQEIRKLGKLHFHGVHTLSDHGKHCPRL